MKRHEYFDLHILENSEIAAVCSSRVIDRITLQQWPLSCVEKITTVDDQQWILKSNHQPCDIEGLFYEQVYHRIILTPLHIDSRHPYQSIIYPYLEGKAVAESSSMNPGDLEYLFHNYHEPLSAIDHLNLPAYLRFDTEKDYLTAVVFIENTVKDLIHQGLFHQVSPSLCQELADILHAPLTLSLAMTNTGLIHGDFSADNILLHDDGQFTILDWQRPMVGSRLVDLFTFYRSLNQQPPAEAVLMGSFPLIYWLADCSIRWFPEGVNTYDQQISQLIADMIGAFHALNRTQINR